MTIDLLSCLRPFHGRRHVQPGEDDCRCAPPWDRHLVECAFLGSLLDRELKKVPATIDFFGSGS